MPPNDIFVGHKTAQAQSHHPAVGAFALLAFIIFTVFPFIRGGSAHATPSAPASRNHNVVPATVPSTESQVEQASITGLYRPDIEAQLPPSSLTAASRVASSLATGYTAPSGTVAECWLPLVRRLQNDSDIPVDTVQFFRNLPEYSPHPMGTKVKELFTNSFLRKSKTPSGAKPKSPPSRIYRNIVTAATVRQCNEFLQRNKAVFDAVEKKYPVPREILVSLLFVETRLGTYIGKENAFWSLACIAAADSPERVAKGLSGIPITEKHASWLQSKLTDKSGWAYKELRALLNFCSLQNLDPQAIPGSVYGAIGICQFMPSNLAPYGEDGDGDGVVNLFSEPDAIFSAARYLYKHGWSGGDAVSRQRAVLKRYNNLNIYANTILTLAESVRTNKLHTAPPDAVRVVRKKQRALP